MAFSDEMNVFVQSPKEAIGNYSALNTVCPEAGFWRAGNGIVHFLDVSDTLEESFPKVDLRDSHSL